MNQHGMRVLPHSESPWGNLTPQNLASEVEKGRWVCGLLKTDNRRLITECLWLSELFRLTKREKKDIMPIDKRNHSIYGGNEV